MQLIHQPRSEQWRIQFAATFTKQTPHSMSPVQFAQGETKIQFASAANQNLIRQGP